MADAHAGSARLRFEHLTLRLGNCVARALPLAVVLHVVEAALVCRIDNAALAALPESAFRTYVIALILAAGVTALACGLFCAVLDLVAERLVRVLAPASPGLLLGFEALRKAGEARGSELVVLGCIALGLGVAVAAWVLLHGHAITRLQHRGAAWASLAIAIAAGAGSIAIVRDAVPAAIHPAPAPRTKPASVPRANLPAAKHLVVVLIDTLRADHMSCYGYARKTTPNLERFASESVLFEQCMCPKPQTTPAVASLFTGLFPRSTGIVKTMTDLMPEFTTIAEVTKAAGFTNVGWSANAMVSPEFGFAQGFDTFEFVPRANRSRDDADGALVTKPALGRIRELAQAGGRFFAYVHIVEPHAPYTPRPDDLKAFRSDALYGALPQPPLKRNAVSYIDGIRDNVWIDEEGGNTAGYVARYDAEIVHADRIVGEFIAGLDALGLKDDTALVVVADHGESMVEHHAYFNHGIFAYEEQVRVPLLVRTQGAAAGTRRAEVVSLVGLMPTLLDLVGLEVPATQVQEPSFHALLAPAAPATKDRWTLLSSGYRMQRLAYAIRSDDHKFIDNKTRRSPWTLLEPRTLLRPGRRFALALSEWRDSELDVELYDLRQDPLELTNLAFRETSFTATFAARLDAMLGQIRAPKTLPKVRSPQELSPIIFEDAAGNGYLGGGGQQPVDSDAAETDAAEKDEG